MILSKAAIWLLCAFLLLSVFMANLMNLIATDHGFSKKYEENDLNFVKHLENKYVKITDTPENIIWFLQISDIHISIFRDSGRISQFQQFCDNTVKEIKPIVVLATGDLTDAKAKDNLGSSQVKTEWVYYHNIVQESGVTNDTVWLDIRGNHDNFNVRSLNAQENYFKEFSVQGAKFAKSYLHLEKKNGINVAFLGIDACPDPGLRRPFNFIGLLNYQEQQHLKKLQAEAEQKADHIVWFGHYPTSCILPIDNNSQSFNLRNLIGSYKGSQAYVCGHLHSMGGIVPKMYTKHKRGFLELELSDWKDNRMFRLIAIDHGHFSFVDQKHNTWPIVLVTNPKHAKYTMRGREPLDLIPDSTHIRILAFSDVDIFSVRISFDNESWMSCKKTQGPLFTCTWLPNLFKQGVHNMYVSVKDQYGKTADIIHPFSLDGSSVHFEVLPRILLMLDAGVVFQAIFGTLLLINVVPLVLLRLQKPPPKISHRLCNFIARRVWLLSKIDRIFYPIVLYAVYMPFGPWAVGELIDGSIGAIFAWGILIKGTFLPEPFTYMYGSVQLMFVQIPQIFVLAYCLDNRLFANSYRGVKRLIRNLPFICLLSMELLLAYFFWLEYGTLSFCLGPLRTWSVPLSILMWYKTLTLPPDYCRNLVKLLEVNTYDLRS